MDKDRFIKWFLNQSDYRFWDSPVIELTLKNVTVLNLSQNSATVEYEFWAHDPTTVRADSALIVVPYSGVANSCSENSFPNQIGSTLIKAECCCPFPKPIHISISNCS